jgi:elongation factor P
VKVIASSLRKGNVVEMDGKLYAVLKAENFHPGKGTPTTSVDMRRISDGVKVSERWRTTEMVEKATVDEREYDFLYEDGEGYHFMEPNTYEQIAVSPDVVGEDKVFLTEGIKVYLKTFEGIAIAIELPQRVTLEISETEPVTKGQTASSSYKPAILSNGVRTTVPPHITAGTRVIQIRAPRRSAAVTRAPVISAPCSTAWNSEAASRSASRRSAISRRA